MSVLQNIQPESGLWIAPNILTWCHRQFFDVALFLLSSLVTGPSFMSISSLVLELWQFSFIRDWPEIRKSEIPPSEFCPISWDWGKLWITNLAQMSLMKSYSMLQNSKVTAFTVSKLLRENQLSGLTEIWYVDWFEYAEFNGCVHLFWFRLKVPFLGKFAPENQNC